MRADPFLRVRGLAKNYAFHDVSFELARGSLLGLTGASGAGKSTLARCIAGFETADRGEILLNGSPRWPRQDVQLIFQQPAASLNPRFTAEEIVSEPWLIARQGDARSRSARARELMAAAGLDPAAARLRPHEFSGGERQRLAFARSLALEPKLLILDESFAALDLSVQAQIANLLLDAQARRHLTCILIAHDRALVARIATELAVLEGGTIVERRAV